MSKSSQQVLVVCTLSLLLNACDLDNLRYQLAIAPQVRQQQEFERNVAELVQRDQPIFERQEPIKAGTKIPLDFVPGQLEGKWKGIACNEQIHVSYTLRMMERTRTFDRVMNRTEMGTISGEITASGLSRSSASTLETGLEGSFDRDSGFLRLHASPRLAEFIAKEQDAENRLEWEAKKQIDAVRNKSVTRETLNSHLQEVETLQRLENDRLRNVEAEIRQRYQLAKDAVVPFTITLTRDVQGNGWTGVIEGQDFGECQLTVVSQSGRRTDKLPPITGQVALKKVYDLYGERRSHSLASRYWLERAATDAKEDDFALLGFLFEQDGERSVEQYVRAEKFYRALNESRPDARAQEGLGRLYTKRLVPSGSVEEGKQLSQLAEKTKTQAQSVCESHQFRQAFGLMAMKVRLMQDAGNALSDKLNNPSREPLEMSGVKFRATDIKSMEREFLCVTSIPRPQTRLPKGLENENLGNQFLGWMLKALVDQAIAQQQKRDGDILLVTIVNAAGERRFKLEFYIDQTFQDSAIIDLG
ncbi:MAG: hypothetical protein LKG23_10865 [Nitrospira sp.]|jgi:hypothetical protein|nr:hypothetical protein [Nitrospira sp.]